MRTCPLLDEDGKVRVNFLGDTPIEYVIEEVPAEPIVKRYVDGSSIRQVLLFSPVVTITTKAQYKICFPSNFMKTFQIGSSNKR